MKSSKYLYKSWKLKPQSLKLYVGSVFVHSPITYNLKDNDILCQARSLKKVQDEVSEFKSQI